MPSTVAKYFAYQHLPAHLKPTSKAIADLADEMERDLPDGPEKSAGMRKLLEAKDCFVRAALEREHHQANLRTWADPAKAPHMVMPGLIEFAVARWNDEVKDRPLVNVHRRTMDDLWRQVIRFAGAVPESLIGPSHDELLASAQPEAKGSAS